MIIKHGRHICLRNAPGAQRFVEFFFLIVLFGCWLAVQAKSNHVGVLVSLLLLLFPFISVYVDGWLWRLPLTWMLLLVLSKFAWNLTHVIRANQHPKRKKPTYLCAPREFLKMCPMCDNLTFLLFWLKIFKPLTCSRCVICVSCSVHLISMYFMLPRYSVSIG